MNIDCYLFFVVLGAYLIKYVTGFGNTLIINSLLSFARENKFISPVDLILNLPTNAYMAWKDRKAINFRIVIPLSITVIIGNILGIFFLQVGGDKELKSILGMVLIVLAIEMYTRKNKSETAETQDSKTAVVLLVGTISGVLMGMYGIGALLAAYISRYTNQRSNYRGNLCFVFLFDNIFRFIGYCYNGLINSEILCIALGLAPAVFVGMFIGIRVDAKVDERLINKCIILLLLVTGIVYIFTNKFGLA
jgi:uncharacterized membrane protein YfcA